MAKISYKLGTPDHVLNMIDNGDASGWTREFYCGKCNALRRVSVTHLYSFNNGRPSLLRYICGACESIYFPLLFFGAKGLTLLIASQVGTGIQCEVAPAGVNYYLDQAAKCESTGALSAAVGMYRVALECFLYDQGFKKGMIGKKLQALERRARRADAADWMRNLDSEMMKVLNRLGNAAMHYDGDIAAQAILDKDTLIAVRDTFAWILGAAYEEPLKRKAAAAKIQAALTAMKKPQKAPSTPGTHAQGSP